MKATIEQVMNIQVGETLETECHTLVAKWNERYQEINVIILDDGKAVGYYAPETYVNIFMEKSV